MPVIIPESLFVSFWSQGRKAEDVRSKLKEEAEVEVGTALVLKRWENTGLSLCRTSRLGLTWYWCAGLLQEKKMGARRRK